MEGEFEERDTEDAWDVDPETDRPAAEAPPPPLMRQSTARPAAAGVEAQPLTADQVADHYASHLADTSASAFMYFTMAGVFRQADALAYKKFRDRLLAECGSPTDPVEIMMVEQLALAHLNAGRLHFKSAVADSLEAARVYGSMAILLMGEFRRGAMALKAYRAKAPAAGPGESADAGAANPAGARHKGTDGELGSKPGGTDHGDDTIPLSPEPEAGGGGPAEPGPAARPVRRRARQAS